MKVGLVVDGRSEFASLPPLCVRLKDLTGHAFPKPIHADIQPMAPVGVIVRQCAKPVNQWFLRGADRVVVLVDRETRDECPGVLANEIGTALVAATRPGVEVVIKNRTFENWLIADLAALHEMPARFKLSQATTRAVRPNKADTVPALTLLKRSTVGDAFDKVSDAKKIMEKAAPLAIASNSRSFRRFLRAAGCASYRDQSRQPV